VSAKGEESYLKQWIGKGKGLGKEPPKADEAPYHIEGPRHDVVESNVEQLNLKVPTGTKLRLKRLGLEQGGLSMLAIFKHMLDEYEARHREKQKG